MCVYHYITVLWLRNLYHFTCTVLLGFHLPYKHHKLDEVFTSIVLYFTDTVYSAKRVSCIYVYNICNHITFCMCFTIFINWSRDVTLSIVELHWSITRYIRWVEIYTYWLTKVLIVVNLSGDSGWVYLVSCV